MSSAASEATLTCRRVAVTTQLSGTSVQPGSSSPGSEATVTDEPAGSDRCHKVSPAVVAAITRPSVSRKLNRPVTPAARSARTVSASACAGSAPSSSRYRTSAHSRAESTRASRPSSALAGRVAASPATESGHPSTLPLWLNSQQPDVYGATAAVPRSVPSVAERTAASTALALVTLAMSAKDSSPQIGTERRYLAGAGSSGAYQPTPNPSAFTVPYRCLRGAQAWRYRPCGGSMSTERSVTGGPRWARCRHIRSGGSGGKDFPPGSGGSGGVVPPGKHCGRSGSRRRSAA